MAHLEQGSRASRSAFADLVIDRALRIMMGEGIPFELMMDRLLTTAAAQIASNDGPEKTADMFRAMAANIDAGALDSLRSASPASVQ